MATTKKKARTTKSKKKVAQKPTKGVPRTEIEYLELLIKYDERNIDGSGSSLDQLFQGQKDRKLKRIEELKGSK